MRAGDRIIGFASPGLRCNGYSLARAALLERAGMSLDEPAWPGSHNSLADVLLEPSVIYAPAMLELTRKVPVHAFAHVTGGGILGNLSRVLPDGVSARIDWDSWERPAVFAWIAERGVPEDEARRVFNLGIGMCAVVPEAPPGALVIGALE